MRTATGVPHQPPLHTAAQQLPPARTTPLLPLVTSQTSPDPSVQVSQRAQYLGNAEVRFPSKQDTSQVRKKPFLTKPWAEVRESVHVKLLEVDDEVYVLARSDDRVHKERGMRTRRLRKLLTRLGELQRQQLTRDELLLKVGAARKDAGRAWALVDVRWPEPDQPLNDTTFTFAINRKKLRVARRREGRYLLRSNMRGEDPAKLWQFYIQLTQVEQAFKELKSDLRLRPIFHHKDERIEAHIFVAFCAYCLHVTLKQRLRPLASGLTPTAALETFATMQMVDVHVPTTDGRQLVLTRYTQPDREQLLLLEQLALTLPEQPPPRIHAGGTLAE